jgi:large subunit ribosomal protein L29
MKFVELKNKDKAELKEMVVGLKKELFNLRFQRATGELANASRFGQVRRDIARIKTALNMSDEQLAAIAGEPAAKKTKAAKPKAEKKAAAKPKAKKEA